MTHDARQAATREFVLGERPGEAIELYCAACSLTQATLSEAGVTQWSMSPNPRSAYFFLFDLEDRIPKSNPLVHLGALAQISRLWWNYSACYRQIVSRSPLMELEIYLERLSQSHASNSWCDAAENITAWLDSGAKGEPPIDDKDQVLSPRVVRRMREIREFTGGWLYGYNWGTYFLTDEQEANVPRIDGRQHLEDLQSRRPSFEGL